MMPMTNMMPPTAALAAPAMRNLRPGSEAVAAAVLGVGAVRRLRNVAEIGLVEVHGLFVLAGLPVRLREVVEERGVVLQLVCGLELLDRLVVVAEVVGRRATRVVLLGGGLDVLRPV